MEREERVRRYKDGESIYAIAKLAGVSRQSVMRSLERAGVYERGDVNIPKKEKNVKIKVKKVERMRPSFVGGLPFDPADLDDEPDARGTLGRNLKKTASGYEVFDMRNGGWRKFKTVDEIKLDYGI